MARLTLAQFKRDMVPGVRVELIEIKERRYIDEGEDRGTWETVGIAERIAGPRVISCADSTGFYLKPESDTTPKRGSFCGFPKADDLAYLGETFTIVEKDGRDAPWQMRTYKIIK